MCCARARSETASAAATAEPISFASATAMRPPALDESFERLHLRGAEALRQHTVHDDHPQVTTKLRVDNWLEVEDLFFPR